MIISLTGPSGIGKGYISQHILSSNPGIKELCWLTTRQPRVGQSETNRIFVTPSVFKKMRNRNQLVLVQKLFGFWYGLKKDELTTKNSSVLFTELHVDNLIRLFHLNITSLVSLGLVANSTSFLQTRLEQYRATETSTEIRRRISSAKREQKTILENQHLFSAIVRISEQTEKEVLEVVSSILVNHLRGR